MLNTALSCDVNSIKKLMIDNGFYSITLSEASKINAMTLELVLQGKDQPYSKVVNKLIDTPNIPISGVGIRNIKGKIFFKMTYLISKKTRQIYHLKKVK